MIACRRPVVSVVWYLSECSRAASGHTSRRRQRSGRYLLPARTKLCSLAYSRPTSLQNSLAGGAASHASCGCTAVAVHIRVGATALRLSKIRYIGRGTLSLLTAAHAAHGWRRTTTFSLRALLPTSPPPDWSALRYLRRWADGERGGGGLRPRLRLPESARL